MERTRYCKIKFHSAYGDIIISQVVQLSNSEVRQLTRDSEIANAIRVFFDSRLDKLALTFQTGRISESLDRLFLKEE